MKGEHQIHYEIISVSFDLQQGKHLVVAQGPLTINNHNFNFTLHIAQKDSTTWNIVNIRTFPPLPNFINAQDLMKPIAQTLVELIRTTNMWPGKQSDRGAQIIVNEIYREIDELAVSFRSNMFNVPDDRWEQMWHLIESRVRADNFFGVQGYSQHQILDAISEIKGIFTHEWVKARYRKLGLKKPTMNMHYPQSMKDWFPACILARTALGLVCIDPAWNYLVELGLALKNLKDYEGLDNLRRQLARSSGTIHHIALAAELHERGYLVGLETPTGSGSNLNDLHVKMGQNEFDIEVKEFSSTQPFNRLEKEIQRKNKAIGKNQKRPMVFHVVLLEKETPDLRAAEKFFNQVEQLDLPDGISAVVAGVRVIDSKGSKIKREVRAIAINPNARFSCQGSHLEVLFEKNFEILHYPAFGIGSFIEILPSDKAPKNKTSQKT